MIVLLDWDDTLVEDNSSQLKPEALASVRALHAAGHTLVLFSHNPAAWRLAGQLELHKYLTHNASGRHDELKRWNLELALAQTAKPVSDLILFDDNRCICAAFRALGVRTCHVRRAGLHLLHAIRRGLLPWHEVFGYSLGHLC